MNSIFVIIQTTTESEYGYGGWTGNETDDVEILGYVDTQEEADKEIEKLRLSESRKKKRHYNSREFSWEEVFKQNL